MEILAHSSDDVINLLGNLFYKRKRNAWDKLTESCQNCSENTRKNEAAEINYALTLLCQIIKSRKTKYFLKVKKIMNKQKFLVVNAKLKMTIPLFCFTLRRLVLNKKRDTMLTLFTNTTIPLFNGRYPVLNIQAVKLHKKKRQLEVSLLMMFLTKFFKKKLQMNTAYFFRHIIQFIYYIDKFTRALRLFEENRKLMDFKNRMYALKTFRMHGKEPAVPFPEDESKGNRYIAQCAYFVDKLNWCIDRRVYMAFSNIKN